MFIRILIGSEDAPRAALPISQRGHCCVVEPPSCPPCLLPVSSSPLLLSFCFIESYQLRAMRNKCLKGLLAASMVPFPTPTSPPRRYHPQHRNPRHRPQPLQSLSKPPAAHSDNFVTPIVNQRRVSFATYQTFVRNTYLFIFLVSHIFFRILCLPLTYLQRYPLGSTFYLATFFVDSS
jgi:hypothetical protein